MLASDLGQRWENDRAATGNEQDCQCDKNGTRLFERMSAQRYEVWSRERTWKQPSSANDIHRLPVASKTAKPLVAPEKATVFE